MGERGRLRKPTELIKLAGNPGHIAKGSLESEPLPEAVLPPCPPDLHKGARKAWKYYAQKLYDQGLLTELDLEILRQLCMAIQMRDEMFNAMQKACIYFRNGKKRTGLTAYTHAKSFQMMGEYKLYKDASAEVVVLCKHFGMSPSTRSRMHVSKRVDVDPTGIDAYMGVG